MKAAMMINRDDYDLQDKLKKFISYVYNSYDKFHLTFPTVSNDADVVYVELIGGLLKDRSQAIKLIDGYITLYYILQELQGAKK